MQAPLGKRVWLELTDYEITDDCVLDIDVGDGVFVPFQERRHINDGVFVSRSERLKIRLKSGGRPRGRGFRAIYKTSKCFFFFILNVFLRIVDGLVSLSLGPSPELDGLISLTWTQI